MPRIRIDFTKCATLYSAFLTAFCLAFLAGCSVTGRVQGVSGEPVARALVSAGGRGAVTDSAGCFTTIIYLPVSGTSFSVSAEGYRPFTGGYAYRVGYVSIQLEASASTSASQAEWSNERLEIPALRSCGN